MGIIDLCIVDDRKFQKVSLYNTEHFYYEFNQDKFDNQIILLMNINEHWNNLELFKFYIWCKRKKIRVITYGHLNEFPLYSLFSDAVVLFPKNKMMPSSLYEGGSVYTFNDRVVASVALQETNGPGALSFLDRRRWEINPELLEKFDLKQFEGAMDHNVITGHVVGLSKGYQNSAVKPYHILLDMAMQEVSDEEVVEKFAFPKVWVRASSLMIWNKFKSSEFINKEFPKNTVMCEVKQQDSCGGKHLLEILHKSTQEHPLKFVSDWELKRKMVEMAGEDNYMEIQVLGSFYYNWMWISYGGSAHIFTLLPLKVLSLSDQGVFYDLMRKIALVRFGEEMGSIFPEFNTLIYCMPGERDGPSRTDGHPPLPNLQKLTKDFSDYKFEFAIKSPDVKKIM